MPATLADEAADLRQGDAEMRMRHDEAPARPTPSAEILQSNDGSPGELVPRFAATAENTRLCGADFGNFFTYGREHPFSSAVRGAITAYIEFLTNNTLRPTPDNLRGRMISGEPFVQIPNASTASTNQTGDPMARAAWPSYADCIRVCGRNLGPRQLHQHAGRDRGQAPPPSVTNKPTGQRPRLGLLVSYDIVTQRHGAAAGVASRAGGFTEFTVRLPRDRPALNHGAAN